MNWPGRAGHYMIDYSAVLCAEPKTHFDDRQWLGRGEDRPSGDYKKGTN